MPRASQYPKAVLSSQSTRGLMYCTSRQMAQRSRPQAPAHAQSICQPGTQHSSHSSPAHNHTAAGVAVTSNQVTSCTVRKPGAAQRALTKRHMPSDQNCLRAAFSFTTTVGVSASLPPTQRCSAAPGTPHACMHATAATCGQARGQTNTTATTSHRHGSRGRHGSKVASASTQLGCDWWHGRSLALLPLLHCQCHTAPLLQQASM